MPPKIRFFWQRDSCSELKRVYVILCFIVCLLISVVLVVLLLLLPPDVVCVPQTALGRPSSSPSPFPPTSASPPASSASPASPTTLRLRMTTPTFDVLNGLTQEIDSNQRGWAETEAGAVFHKLKRCNSKATVFIINIFHLIGKLWGSQVDMLRSNMRTFETIYKCNLCCWLEKVMKLNCMQDTEYL